MSKRDRRLEAIKKKSFFSALVPMISSTRAAALRLRQ
jgi:hypothetical protein